jgi:aspartyl-tRNA(Asn)/glutamyl-tRNA(Gln) amidotransferase subunit C
MAVDTETVRQMARLARLTVEEDRLEQVAQQMSEILDFMGEINAFKAEDTEPDWQQPSTARRADVVEDFTPLDRSEDTNKTQENFVRVPPIKGAH